MLQFVKNAVNKIQSIVTNHGRPVRKKKLREAEFIPEFGTIGKNLKNQNRTLKGNSSMRGFQGRPIKIQTATTRQQRLKQCEIVAWSVQPIELPDRFVGEMGPALLDLIISTYNEKNKTNPNLIYMRNYKKSATSLELWQHFQTHKSTPNHIANTFFLNGFTDEKQFRVLSRPFLKIKVPVRALSKTLSNYGGPHSCEHMEFLDLINLNKNNAHLWYPEILEDRSYLNVHKYEVGTNQSLNISYLVPIAIQSTLHQPQLYASDPANIFNTDLLCMKLVTTHRLITPIAGFNETSQVITAYLHNRPFQKQDEENLLNVCPDSLHWGGSLNEVQKYINLVGQTGLPRLTTNSSGSFPLFPTLPTPNRASRGNQIEDRYLLNPNNFGKKDKYIYKVDPLTNKINPSFEIDADKCSLDITYHTRAYIEFALISQKIENRLRDFHAQL